MAVNIRMAKSKGTRRSSLNKRRKGVLAVTLPWLRRFGLILGALVLALWLGAWFILSGSAGKTSEWGKDKIILASADMGFRVENILVEGRNRTDSKALMAAIGMQKNDPLFAFDPQAAQQALQDINWVKDAHVERRLPDTIYVRLQERRPEALWQDGKDIVVLDESGQPIKGADIKAFKSILLLAGTDAPQAFQDFLNTVKIEEPVYKRIRLATHISGRRWDITLKNGLKIKLPEDDMPLALRRLARAQEENGLLDKDIISIDLRDPERLAIQTRPGQLQDYQDSLKTSVKAGNSI
ncbi:MAG: FtsQ-type POTRA domain-containing protein [Alphaproteobacteria bacterium]|nr:FtsQ-type POTRA domain-containing protein [Alphaproteobacteria bacterium]